MGDLYFHVKNKIFHYFYKEAPKTFLFHCVTQQLHTICNKNELRIKQERVLFNYLISNPNDKIIKKKYTLHKYALYVIIVLFHLPILPLWCTRCIDGLKEKKCIWVTFNNASLNNMTSFLLDIIMAQKEAIWQDNNLVFGSILKIFIPFSFGEYYVDL